MSWRLLEYQADLFEYNGVCGGGQKKDEGKKGGVP